MPADAPNQESPFGPELTGLLIGRTVGFQIPFVPGDTVGLRGTPDGSQRVAELRNTLGLSGLCYAVNYGQAQTYVTGKLVGAFLATEPDFNLDIPGGTCVIPLGLNVSCGAMTGTLNHMFLWSAPNVVGNGTSTAATAGPRPLLVGTNGASQCTARQAYSAAGTAPGGPIELWSWDIPTVPAATANLSFAWTPATLSPIIGPACLAGYSVATTTAFTFKAQLIYAELPATYAA